MVLAMALLGLALVLAWLALLVGRLPAPGPWPSPPAEATTPAGRPTPAPSVPGGLHVVVLYDGQSLSPTTSAILRDEGLRTYLQRACAPQATGLGRDWWFWDVRHPWPPVAPPVLGALAAPRSGTPWLIVSGPRGAFAGPLPGTVDATLTVLRGCQNGS